MFGETGQRETIVVREREREREGSCRGGSMPRGGFVLSYREPAADIDWSTDRSGGFMVAWWLIDGLEAAGAAAVMDVTLSELLASFMDSPLVLWVSSDDGHELLTSDLWVTFSPLTTSTQIRTSLTIVEELSPLTSNLPVCSLTMLTLWLTQFTLLHYCDRGTIFRVKASD